jgi:AraC family transcriptional regulator
MTTSRIMIMHVSFEELGVRALAEDGEPTIMPKRTNTAPWQVRCIHAHIAANIHAALRTPDLAAVVGFSAYRIKCAFKDHFGCAPHQYLMRRRVERAQRLLLISNDHLSQIAAQCGFASQSHLSKVFHKIVGERPGRWRRIQTERDL